MDQREVDLAAVQSALQAIESEKRQLGESATTDRFSLELEVDRLRRDLQRCEEDLDRAREEVRDRDKARRDRESALDKLVRLDSFRYRDAMLNYLHVQNDENRELSNQLAAQQQTRLNFSEKLDHAQAVRTLWCQQSPSIALTHPSQFILFF